MSLKEGLPGFSPPGPNTQVDLHHSGNLESYKPLQWPFLYPAPWMEQFAIGCKKKSTFLSDYKSIFCK